MSALPTGRVLVGDVLDRLAELPSGSVDCVITSPPYFQLRDYGVVGQLGLESSVDGWVASLAAVCDELARVMTPAGGLWLNLGDSYSRGPTYGAPAKGLLAAPERLLLALTERGWLCRNKVIWAKPNPMPTSVRDRLNAAYEVIYFLVRSPRYYFALDLIREPHRSRNVRRTTVAMDEKPHWAGPLAGKHDGLKRARPDGVPGHQLGRNPGDVWSIPTRGFRGAHFATFPEALVTRPLLASCPEAVCTACGEPLTRQVSVRRVPVTGPTAQPRPGDAHVFRFKEFWNTVRTVGELVPCGCGAPTRRGVVLDPFLGAGTVGLVAERLGRDWVGIELNPEFARLATDRIAAARRERAAEADRAA
ncbi:MAG: DNA-methyltransferase [Acidimicrobiales bacterium]